VSALEAAIRRARHERHRAAFVPFLTAGYPDLPTTEQLAADLAAAGADALEIGIPFSDPLADGPVIQASSQAALDAGVTPHAALETVTAIRERTGVPVVVMSYINPLLQLPGGSDSLFESYRFDGLLLTDVPVDQPLPLWQAMDAAGVDPVLLVGPTTPAQRIATIAARARGFIYCVSRLGVTGGGMDAGDRLGERVAAIRSATPLPVLVGFGVASEADARRAARLADGVVVGSALIRLIGAGGDVRGAVRQLAEALIAGLHS